MLLSKKGIMFEELRGIIPCAKQGALHRNQ